MRVVLISTYELGRQPFGLDSPAAWLRAAGAGVTCLDLAVQAFEPDVLADAGLVCFYLPMHTATRLAVPWIAQVRRLAPQARICCYGLYAPVNAAYLRSLGVHDLIGGEFEAALQQLYRELQQGRAEARHTVALERLEFLPPARDDLPELARYGRVLLPDGSRRISGYTETSRGCKHRCRHCPVVPVYNSRADFIQAVALCRRHGLVLNPTFVTFTPWISRAKYVDLLRLIAELDLVDYVSPIQYAIRLLIPDGSRLLELPETHAFISGFDPAALCYRWNHPDPAMDDLYFTVMGIVQAGQGEGADRATMFARIRAAAGDNAPLPDWQHGRPTALVPQMSEPWYC
jgi:hypothetical protein